MEDKLVIEARGLGKDYCNHRIFEFLDDLNNFYGFLADSCSNTADGMIITGKFSVGCPMFSSIQGTLESIKILIYAGRVNDAFALGRKYADAILTALYVYVLVKQDEKKIIETEADLKSIFSMSDVRTWSNMGKELFWKKSKAQKAIEIIDPELWKLFHLSSDEYSKQEENGNPKSGTGKVPEEERLDFNDNVHYNSLSIFANNDYDMLSLNGKGPGLLNLLYDLLSQEFAFHFAFQYVMVPHVYGSNDYIDDLENGEQPKQDSQYWVASIVQDVFDKYIKSKYSEVADYLIKKTLMELK